MRDVDFIIVGQGLAGTCLAWELRTLGADVVVIDREAAVTSSRIAAGLITPVTGQRMVKTWRWEELRAAAWGFYRRMEGELGCSLLRETAMVKVFTSPQERDYFEKRIQAPDYEGLLRAGTELPAGVTALLGCCELLQGGQLDVAKFLEQSRARWIPGDSYRSGELLLSDDLQLAGNDVELPRWGLRARKVIFCQGIEARSNPWFSNVEFNPARGEMLLVRIPDWNEVRVIHGAVWIAPVRTHGNGEGLYRVGATYDWNNLDSGPTLEGRRSLVESLEKLLHVPYEIIDHQTAVRPILKQLNPVIGLHPRHPQLGYMNGLASKGSLQSPFFSRQFAMHLVRHTPIEHEVNIQSRVSWPSDHP